MDQESLERTRRALHGVAEFVLAGPQYAQSRSIRLKVTPDGFGTCALPHVRVEGVDLVTPDARVPLTSTCADLARAAGLETRDLREVYSDGPDLGIDEPLLVDPAAAAVIMNAFAHGDVALREFAPAEEPVLWPEHFDLAITVDEVNYGVSPGDAFSGTPYAYVGPWSPRAGSFWNAPFGAVRRMVELPDDGALVHFFCEGAEHASADPPRDG